ncbi:MULTISPECIES: hypothetical protein [unclassified Streptomyces]|uniref:hypothetical protein n=1 Tax=unclassified Streptomyces TaxID=2593676 RepID=UPI00224DA4A5|nr:MULTISPECIES: hypothetical protein [unclassified Streptomyces]MCX5002147.1 hypothetical protein [Streptomyces sp. NBC_00638]
MSDTLFWMLVFLTVVSSTIADAGTRAAVATRKVFVLGRIRVLSPPGVIAFVLAPPTAAGPRFFDVPSGPTAPVSYAGPVVAVRMPAGVVILIILLRLPWRTAGTARVHLETSTPAPRQSGAVQP